MKQILVDDYAHLAWMASAQSGVNLPVLQRNAARALDEATTDAEAEQVLRTFVAGIGDGHLKLLERQTLPAASASPPPPVDPRTLDAANGCAALGIADEGQHDFSLPLHTLPGYHAVAGGADPPLRNGVATLANGHRIGLLRLHEFDALRYPGLCHRLWPQLRHAASVHEMRSTLGEAWVAEIAAALRRFQQQAVDAVLVDVGSNPGGDDSGDTLTRLFSDRPVASATLWVSQSPAGAGYLQEQWDRLDNALRHHHPDAHARPLLEDQRNRFAASLRAAARPDCDLAWAWQSQRAYPAQACRNLVPAGSSGGPLTSPVVDTLDDFLVAHRLDWAQDLRRHWGAWHGPVYVLTDARTASSAEMFAARLQDNRIARVVGGRSGGYGCGFMTAPGPRVLPHSQLRVRVPNCVRLRADGSDEVAGIQPDLPIAARAGESARARAQRLLDTVSEDLARH
ncbi:hypothetical protein KQ945_08980 [Bacillus subtilis subsp. subtilis]|nr:hypothetical protein [Bacillus subtilis subsp. subtilis]